MEAGLSVLLQVVDNGDIDNLEFNFFCLFLPLNFKPYFVMLSDVMSGNVPQDPVAESDPIISVLISNYPLANGGYLVSFGQDKPDGSFDNYAPDFSMDFEASKLSKFLERSSIFLPRGCYYLSELELSAFIRSLAYGASSFDMRLLPASHQMQGLLMVKVNERSFFKYEPKEEVKR